MKSFVSATQLSQTLSTAQLQNVKVPVVPFNALIASVLQQENLTRIRAGIYAIAHRVRINKKYPHIVPATYAKYECLEVVAKTSWAAENNNTASDTAYGLLLATYAFEPRDCESGDDCFEPRAIFTQVGVGSKKHQQPRMVNWRLDDNALIIDRIVCQIDAMYKLYTSIFRQSSVRSIRDILEDMIITKSAHILDLLMNHEVIADKARVPVCHFLEMFLRLLLKKHPNVNDEIHPEWMYLELFCHCVRHNTITKVAGELFMIRNQVRGTNSYLVLPRKLFVKTIVCLVNIVHSIVTDNANVSLSVEVCKNIGLADKIVYEHLQEEVIQQIQALLLTPSSFDDE